MYFLNILWHKLDNFNTSDIIKYLITILTWNKTTFLIVTCLNTTKILIIQFKKYIIPTKKVTIEQLLIKNELRVPFKIKFDCFYYFDYRKELREEKNVNILQDKVHQTYHVYKQHSYIVICINIVFILNLFYNILVNYIILYFLTFYNTLVNYWYYIWTC